MIQRFEIQKYFAKFYSKEIPELMKLYGKAHPYVIGEVFMIQRDIPGLLDENGKQAVEGWTFPLCKVYNVGDEWKGSKGIVVGDIVRMRDYDALSQRNPLYDKAVKNEFTNSPTTTRDGKMPPEYLNNLMGTFRQRIFCPDPFQMVFDDWGGNVFFFDIGNLLMPLDKESIAMLHPHGRIKE